MSLTKEEHNLLLEMMQHGGYHIQLKEQTRHLVIQKLLIDYIYYQRSRQLDAIAVCIIQLLWLRFNGKSLFSEST